MSEHKTACPHLRDGPDLEVLLVTDAHLQIADAFVRCRECDAHYLIELVDLLGKDSAYRISSVAEADARAAIKSLSKGSCDINRARNEVFSVSTRAQRLSGLLLAQGGAFLRLVETNPALELPSRNWRELPCDGTLITTALLTEVSYART